MIERSTDLADKYAILLSGICVLHCMLPFLLVFILPYVTGLAFLMDESFHLMILILIVPISLLSIGSGYKKHKNNQVLGSALAGLVILILAALYGHDWFGHTMEVVLTVFGSVLVALGHVKNLKTRRNMAIVHVREKSQVHQ